MTFAEAIRVLGLQAPKRADISVCERKMRIGKDGEVIYLATVTIEGGGCYQSRVSIEDAVRQALAALGLPPNLEEVARMLAYEWCGVGYGELPDAEVHADSLDVVEKGRGALEGEVGL